MAAWVDWLYMVTLLAIGVALILGIATKLAAIGSRYYGLGKAWQKLGFVKDRRYLH